MFIPPPPDPPPPPPLHTPKPSPMAWYTSFSRAYVTKACAHFGCGPNGRGLAAALTPFVCARCTPDLCGAKMLRPQKANANMPPKSWICPPPPPPLDSFVTPVLTFAHSGLRVSCICDNCFRVRWGRGGAGMHWNGGSPPPPPPTRRPATVPLTASANFNGICNRQ